MSKPINDESDRQPICVDIGKSRIFVKLDESDNFPNDSTNYLDGSELFIRRKRSFGKTILTKPNHHGIALNSARVIEDFSKSLEKMKAEKLALIEWLKEAIEEHEKEWRHEQYLKSDVYRLILRKMGEDV